MAGDHAGRQFCGSRIRGSSANQNQPRNFRLITGVVSCDVFGDDCHHPCKLESKVGNALPIARLLSHASFTSSLNHSIDAEKIS